MNWFNKLSVCALTAIGVSAMAILSSAQAEMIGSVNYIQPVSVSTNTSNPGEAGGYSGAVGSLIDGSGVQAWSGYAGNGTMATPTAQTISDGYSANGDGYLLFDLGGLHTLTGMQIWNRNFGTGVSDGNTGAFGAHAPLFAYTNSGGGVGGWHNMVEVQTATDPTLTGSGGLTVFATPLETFGSFGGDAPQAQSTTYAGQLSALAATQAAQYVLFRFRNGTVDVHGGGGSTGAANGYYTSRNETSWWSMNEVRFTEAAAIPEPSTFVLAGLGLVGLGCVTLRKKYRRA